jgi:nicotinamidase-related amidase
MLYRDQFHFPTLAGIDVEHFRKHMYTDPEYPGPLLTGSAGAAIVPSLLPLPGEIKVVKKRFSAFHQTHLDSILRRMGCDHVVLCGVQTPNCIRATAFDAVSLDYKDVTVLDDCTASTSKTVQDSNLRDLRSIGVHTVEINTAGTLLGWLRPLIVE